MAHIPIQLPPGVVRPGTVHEARGRWYDAQLVRWHAGTLQPWGGWAVLSGASSAQVGGPVRGMLAWKRNNGAAKIAMGTPTKLFVYEAGTLTDVTPVGLTTGSVDASGTFYARTEANSWQMDAYGEDLVAVAYSDGRIWYWDSSAGGAVAALTNAPTLCGGVVVTPERFVVALAPSGDPRLVAWADQEDATDWTTTVNNQAGEQPLATAGAIMAGRRGEKETLIWTDVDLWGMSFQGGPLVFSFGRRGEKCGAISRRSMAMQGARGFWMGQRSFFRYDGFVQELECPVADYVFGRLNRAQASKVACVANSDFNEVTWYYPAGTENDSFVTYNYAEGWWSTGALARTDGVDRDFLEYPLASDASGNVYEHERGSAYTGATEPYAESGPLLPEDGVVKRIREIVPDVSTSSGVDLSLKTRMYPMGSETTHGPYSLTTDKIDTRISTRQVRLLAEHNGAGWRMGAFLLDVVPEGLR